MPITSISHKFVTSSPVDSVRMLHYATKRGFNVDHLPAQVLDQLDTGSSLPAPMKKLILKQFGLPSSATLDDLKNRLRNYSPKELIHGMDKAVRNFGS